MTAVLVHGNPETTAVWGPLRAALAERGVDDVVCVSPPGFGAPVPPGWTATYSEYAAWLVDEVATLAAEHGPVDLVGHDWGAGHVAGAVAARPDLVHTWAIDCAGMLNPWYVWHGLAQVWQTEGRGEQALAGWTAMGTDALTTGFAGNGIPTEIAREMAEAFDQDTARCILALYRSAVQPALTELADRLDAALESGPPPGLLFDATEDAYVSSALVPSVAERFGAHTCSLPGAGHWWLVNPQPVATAADALTAWWSKA
ncbi:MAG: alpha/beta fold hydrolase [Actinomycetales bacterium]